MDSVICDTCKREFPTKESLILHVTHSRSCPTPPQYKCDLCSKQFKARQGLVAHNRVMNGRSCPTLSCAVRSQPDAQSKYQCDVCSNRFVTKPGLAFHISTSHQRHGLFACLICSGQFPHADYLRIHMRNLHLNQTLECDQCNKRFSQKSHLTTHINSVHMSLRPYKCNRCLASFTQSSHLTSHIKAMHKPTVVECDDCGAKLANRRNLAIHVLGVHMKLNQFKCDMCPAAFSYQSELRGHKQAIHKARFVVCDHCGKREETKGKLGNHCLAVHLGLRPYKCGECGKSFGGKSNLASHKRRVHD